MKKIFLLLLIASPYYLIAQGFQVNLQGQKQQAMGGTGAGVVMDAASIFYNPGGVSLLKENSVSAGISPTISNSTFQDANSQSQARTNSPVGTPFTGYAVWGPKESSFKFGIGVYTPFGSTIKWEDGWSGRYTLTELKLSSVFIQPTISYKINDKLGIGAGFVYGVGSIGLKKDLPVVDASGNVGNANLTGNASGIGFNVGIYYKPINKFSVGLTYRSQVNMKVTDGTANFTVPSSLSSSFPSGAFSSSLPLPQVLTLGLGFYPVEKLTIALDASLVGWGSYDTLAFDYANNTSSLKDTKSPRLYKNAFAFRLGGQYKLTENFNVRAGVIYDITPIKDGYVTPEVPDANRLNFTAGIGYKIGSHLVADASFTFENFNKRTDTNLETNLSGTYKTYILIPGLSLSYNF